MGNNNNNDYNAGVVFLYNDVREFIENNGGYDFSDEEGPTPEDYREPRDGEWVVHDATWHAEEEEEAFVDRWDTLGDLNREFVEMRVRAERFQHLSISDDEEEMSY